MLRNTASKNGAVSRQLGGKDANVEQRLLAQCGILNDSNDAMREQHDPIAIGKAT